MDKICGYVDGGQIKRQDLANALKADQDYYTAVASEADCIASYRKLAAVMGSRKMPAAEQAYVYSTFATDVVTAGWSLSQLDRACGAWRASSERFMPTFGQLKAVADEARVYAGPFWLGQLTKVSEPPVAYAPPAKIPKPKPKPLVTADELKARIARMEREKASNSVPRNSGGSTPWGRFDEIMLSGARARLDELKAEATA